jgi:hypothetical protein
MAGGLPVQQVPVAPSVIGLGQAGANQTPRRPDPRPVHQHVGERAGRPDRLAARGVWKRGLMAA